MSLTITRRSALAGGLASAVALTLAACGGKSGSSSADSTASAASNATAVASEAPFYAAATAAPTGAVDVSGVETKGITVSGDTATIKIGASPEPHVTILQWVQDNLTKGTGISLDIVSINDYQTPNSSLNDGSLAANYYQTPNFLQQQIEDKGYDFTGIAKVHIEPMGLYSSTVKSVKDIPDGGTIILNNDPANTARGLKLLAQAGLPLTRPEASRALRHEFPGVTVLVRGTSIGTATNSDGTFSLNAPAGSTLTFSFVGYATQTASIGDGGNTDLKVTLQEDLQKLNEVVVVGYGTQQRQDVTGAVSSISGKDVASQPVPDAAQAIQGRAAGVTVTQNSGAPAARAARRCGCAASLRPATTRRCM